MRNLLAFVLFAFGISQAYARTLIVSDIDDTIKNSHVLDKTEALRNLKRTDNYVLGMPELYKELVDQLMSQGEVVKVVYLSSGPAKLVGSSHTTLIQKSGFPEGEKIFLQDLRKSQDHKITNIRRLIREFQPQKIIFIGDNGERDIEIYDQARNEFSQITSYTFIRTAYFTGNTEDTGKPLRFNQFSFVSSVDIASILTRNGLLTEGTADELLESIFDNLQNQDMNEDDGSILFPRWQDCRDFNKTILNRFDGLFKSYRDIVFGRCSIPAIED